MLKNAYFLANIGANIAENEQHFAEICREICPSRVGDRTIAGGSQAPVNLGVWRWSVGGVRGWVGAVADVECRMNRIMH